MLNIFPIDDNSLRVEYDNKFICRIAREAIHDVQKEFPELGLESIAEYVVNYLQMNGFYCDIQEVKKKLEELL